MSYFCGILFSDFLENLFIYYLFIALSSQPKKSNFGFIVLLPEYELFFVFFKGNEIF